jgi:hypothetical protein
VHRTFRGSSVLEKIALGVMYVGEIMPIYKGRRTGLSQRSWFSALRRRYPKLGRTGNQAYDQLASARFTYRTDAIDVPE